MDRLRFEKGLPPNARAGMRIERVGFDKRMRMEKKYKADPIGMHADLVYGGWWLIANQLKIDHAAGRL